MKADWADYLRFRTAFAGIIDPRLYTIEWLEGLLLSGAAQFWCTENAAIVAEIKFYPTGAMDLHGLIAAGDLADIRDILIPRAEEWAKRVGCIGAIIESREGWAKALKSSGYAPFQVAIRKELR